MYRYAQRSANALCGDIRRAAGRGARGNCGRVRRVHLAVRIAADRGLYPQVPRHAYLPRALTTLHWDAVQQYRVGQVCAAVVLAAVAKHEHVEPVRVSGALGYLGGHKTLATDGLAEAIEPRSPHNSNNNEQQDPQHYTQLDKTPQCFTSTNASNGCLTRCLQSPRRSQRAPARTRYPQKEKWLHRCPGRLTSHDARSSAPTLSRRQPDCPQQPTVCLRCWRLT